MSGLKREVARLSEILRNQGIGHRIILESDAGVGITVVKDAANKRFQLLYMQPDDYPHTGVIVTTVRTTAALESLQNGLRRGNALVHLINHLFPVRPQPRSTVMTVPTALPRCFADAQSHCTTKTVGETSQSTKCAKCALLSVQRCIQGSHVGCML